MPSVTRDKKKFVSAGRGIAQSKASRQTTIAEEDARFYVDNDPRRDADNGYHTGRVKPLIDEDS